MIGFASADIPPPLRKPWSQKVAESTVFFRRYALARIFHESRAAQPDRIKFSAGENFNSPQDAYHFFFRKSREFHEVMSAVCWLDWAWCMEHGAKKTSFTEPNAPSGERSELQLSAVEGPYVALEGITPSPAWRPEEKQ